MDAVFHTEMTRSWNKNSTPDLLSPPRTDPNNTIVLTMGLMLHSISECSLLPKVNAQNHRNVNPPVATCVLVWPWNHLSLIALIVLDKL